MAKQKNNEQDQLPNKSKVSVKMEGSTLTCNLKGNHEGKLYQDMFGIEDRVVFDTLLTQVTNSAFGHDTDGKYNSTMPLLLNIGPRDGIEGMLATQIVATHNMAMEMTRRAMLPEQTVEGVSENLNRTTKLMRTYMAQMETLQKYRSKGEQTIKVQHVTVNDGGQAIVGDVSQGGGDG